MPNNDPAIRSKFGKVISQDGNNQNQFVRGTADGQVLVTSEASLGGLAFTNAYNAFGGNALINGNFQLWQRTASRSITGIAGNVTVTAASTTITGVSTTFTTTFFPGDNIQTAGGQYRRISSIASDTSMTVDIPFTTNESGVAYRVGKYAADRWFGTLGGAGTFTMSRQTFVNGQALVPFNPFYFMRCVQSVAPATGGEIGIRQAIEKVETFGGEKVTISFYAKGLVGGETITPQLEQNYGNGGAVTPAVRVSGTAQVLTTSWARYWQTLTLPAANQVKGSNAETNRLDVILAMPTASLFTIDISMVQIERGTAASNFETKTFDQQRTDCLRYYEASYRDGIFPGNVGDFFNAQRAFAISAANLYVISWNLQKGKRYNASILVIYSPNTGAPGNIFDQSASLDRAATTWSVGTSAIQQGAMLTYVPNNLYAFHYTIDADY